MVIVWTIVPALLFLLVLKNGLFVVVMVLVRRHLKNVLPLQQRVTSLILYNPLDCPIGTSLCFSGTCEVACYEVDGCGVNEVQCPSGQCIPIRQSDIDGTTNYLDRCSMKCVAGGICSIIIDNHRLSSNTCSYAHLFNLTCSLSIL